MTKKQNPICSLISCVKSSLVKSNVMSEELKEPLDDKLYLFNSHIQYQVNQIKQCLLGRILTLIDASVEDRERRKALKDIIRTEIWKEEYFSKEMKEIIIQFAEKFTQVSTEKLKEWSNRTHKKAVRDWFSKF